MRLHLPSHHFKLMQRMIQIWDEPNWLRGELLTSTYICKLCWVTSIWVNRSVEGRNRKSLCCLDVLWWINQWDFGVQEILMREQYHEMFYEQNGIKGDTQKPTGKRGRAKVSRCSEANRWGRIILGVTSHYEVMQKRHKKNKTNVTLAENKGRAIDGFWVCAFLGFCMRVRQLWKLQRKQKLVLLSSGNFGEMFFSLWYF